MTGTSCDIVLASASLSRRRLLGAAGISCRAIASQVDESAIKRRAISSGCSFDDLALQLAQAKALAVAKRFPASLVIGVDQLLIADGELFDKPTCPNEARQQLLRLRGQTHCLETAVVCAAGGEIVWDHHESAELKMRDFSLDYLQSYLSAEGDAVTESVGGYRIEGPGIQLFSRIAGDYFSILGLPLLPLLDFLRSRGAVPA